MILGYWGLTYVPLNKTSHNTTETHRNASMPQHSLHGCYHSTFCSHFREFPESIYHPRLKYRTLDTAQYQGLFLAPVKPKSPRPRSSSDPGSWLRS